MSSYRSEFDQERGSPRGQGVRLRLSELIFILGEAGSPSVATEESGLAGDGVW